mmetsp:Transcript_684/g.1907  ORF Transcript_684/g.1907 Transcript_684/m.1907 type:complete len:377 (+) Transcript_684:450-1580(+)
MADAGHAAGGTDGIKLLRTRVVLGHETVQNVSSTAYPGAYPGVDDSFSIESFAKGFKVDVISETDDVIEFDMIGADAAVANTVRRILIAEVPTMAIENCFIYNNTSIIQDEVLAHRLGLVPIKADPRKFEFSKGTDDRDETNYIVFRLQVKCEKRKDAPADATSHDELYVNHRVLSGDLVWVPQGNQLEEFGEGGIRPVHDDILLAVLRPGQEVDIELHCVKGIGKEHAKWSPVCTASYRLHPEIVLLKEFEGDEADRLAACFGAGVIEVTKDGAGRRVARVNNPRACTMSREVHRHPDLAPHVRLQRIRDHFIFSVESTGALKAAELVSEAIACMVDKAELMLNTLSRLETEVDEDDAMPADNKDAMVAEPDGNL